MILGPAFAIGKGLTLTLAVAELEQPVAVMSPVTVNAELAVGEVTFTVDPEEALSPDDGLHV